MKPGEKQSYEYEMQSLTQENDELRKQLKNLKSQFNKAINVSAELEETYRKNAELSRQLQEYEAKCDDYAKRLEISMKNCEELEQRLKQEPRKSPIKPKVEINKAEIIQLNSRIQGYEKQQIENQEKISAEKRKNRDLENQLTQIYTSASSYFNSQISDINSLLINLVKQPQNHEDNTEQYTAAIRKLKDKVKKWKTLYNEQYERYLEIQSNRPAIQTTREYIDLNTQITELKNTINIQNEKIRSLTDENSSVKTINAQLSARIKISEMHQNETKESEQIQNMNLINQLKTDLANLNSTYEKTKTKQKNYENQYKKSIQTINEQKIVLQDKDHEISTLKAHINEMENDNTELAKEVKQLHKKSQKILKQSKVDQGELSEYKKIVQLRDSEIEKLNDDINRLNFNIKSISNEKDKINEEFGKCKVDLYALQTKISQQHEEFKSKPIESKIPERIVQTDPIPVHFWSTIDFPREITESINSITRNQVLESVPKIKSVIDTIIKYYREKMFDFERKLENLNLQNSEFTKHWSSFAEYLYRRFSDLKIDYQALLTSDNAREILAEHILKMYSNIQNLTEHNQKIDSQLVDIYIALDADTYNDAMTNAQKLREIAFAQKNRIHNLKQEMSEMKKFYKQKAEEFSVFAQNVENEIANMRAEIDEKDNIIGEHVETINAISQKYEEENLILNNDNKTLQIQNNRLTQKVDKLTNSIKECNDNNQSLQEKLKILTNNYKILLNNKDEMEARFNQDIKEKEEHFESQNQLLLNQIRELTNESKTTIDKLREDLNNTDKEKEKAIQDNISLNLKIKQLETKINAVQTEMQRNQKSLEIQSQMRLKNAQTDMMSKINDIEISRDKIMNSVVNNLSSLLASGERLDESSLENSLQGIKNRFDHLIMRDRRMREILNLGPMDSLEDEIEKLLRKRNIR